MRLAAALEFSTIIAHERNCFDLLEKFQLRVKFAFPQTHTHTHAQPFLMHV